MLTKALSARRAKAVVDTARGLADGTVLFVEGVRQLAALRFEVSRLDHDRDFTLFVAIASESDHLPPHELRSQCASAWLEQCDREARELEVLHRQQVRAACARLVGRFSS
ncbi:DUF2489 domain-containing protein [Variovorax beijingensis]|uniref:DUF2489 domain-containing protein n=1 Tax=Variovorax beijingensis TaxID=2496117 RepID=A0ABX9ZWG0_9BURK|nr:DUF2489 domain-containing protein [Variovorax beijingensis]